MGANKSAKLPQRAFLTLPLISFFPLSLYISPLSFFPSRPSETAVGFRSMRCRQRRGGRPIALLAAASATSPLPRGERKDGERRGGTAGRSRSLSPAAAAAKSSGARRVRLCRRRGPGRAPPTFVPLFAHPARHHHHSPSPPHHLRKASCGET